MSLALEVIDRDTVLHRKQAAWVELLARSDSDAPTVTPTWLLNWWRVFGRRNGRELRFGMVNDGGRLIGLAPLLVRRHWYRSGIPFRRLELLGTGESEADEIGSDDLGIISERGCEPDVARALVRGLAAGAFGRWDEVVLSALDGRSPMIEPFVTELTSAGYAVGSVTKTVSPYIDLPATWEAYLERLPGKRRYFIKRSLRDFERWAGEWDLRVPDSASELERARKTLEELHQERWTLDGRRGVFASERFRAFHDLVIPELFGRGQVELVLLEARGRPLSVLYNLVYGGRVYFYQSGRATEVPEHVRVGTVVHALAIQRAIARGLDRYDFLPGPSRYKMQFALDTRPISEIRATSRSAPEAARRLMEASLSRLRATRDAVLYPI
jgi:CelD/BcsL family acetyltransferase involved in cellulose biosynthesis